MKWVSVKRTLIENSKRHETTRNVYMHSATHTRTPVCKLQQKCFFRRSLIGSIIRQNDEWLRFRQNSHTVIHFFPLTFPFVRAHTFTYCKTDIHTDIRIRSSVQPLNVLLFVYKRAQDENESNQWNISKINQINWRTNLYGLKSARTGLSCTSLVALYNNNGSTRRHACAKISIFICQRGNAHHEHTEEMEKREVRKRMHVFVLMLRSKYVLLTSLFRTKAKYL